VRYFRQANWSVCGGGEGKQQLHYLTGNNSAYIREKVYGMGQWKMQSNAIDM